MRAKLRRLHSPDVYDLRKYRPSLEGNFGFLLQVFAGLDQRDGEESFDVVICTPRWLSENHQAQDIIVGRHYLIVFEYDFGRIRKFVEQFCEACTGDTWEQIAARLGTLGKWEFEDYHAPRH